MFVDEVGVGVNRAAKGLNALCVLGADDAVDATLVFEETGSNVGTNATALGLKLIGAILPSTTLSPFSQLDYLPLDNWPSPKLVRLSWVTSIKDGVYRTGGRCCKDQGRSIPSLINTHAAPVV